MKDKYIQKIINQVELTHTKNTPECIVGKTFIAIQCQKMFTKICHCLVQTTIKKSVHHARKGVQISYIGLRLFNIKQSSLM